MNMESRVAVLFGLARDHAARRFPWISKFKVEFCAQADRHHGKKWRQFAHTNHRVYTVCFAKAAEVDLTDEEILGISAHELGHIVGIRLRYPEHSVVANPPHWKEPAELEAQRIAVEVLGFTKLRMNKRTLQELQA
jgi:hypothetical protein